MKFLKHFLLAIVTLGLFVSVASAKTVKSNFSDVAKDYWAITEISSVVADGIMSANDGVFNPEASVTRADFVQMLLKTLGHDDLVVTVKNTFSDVTKTTPAYYDILKSKQLGLVYGYPNGTFMPDKTMSKAEVTSVMSHITKDAQKSLSVLDKFSDTALIPSWAKYQYAKTVVMDLYVNYPDSLAFEPARDITRAETAVLLYKLKNSLQLVKEEFKAACPDEKVLGTEHLDVSSKATTDVVTITSLRKIIKEGNVLKVDFNDLFKSKKAGEGDVVEFIFPENVYTEEGTLVIPAESKLYATVVEIIPAKWFNKNARVALDFNKLQLADGRIMSFKGVVTDKDGYLKEGPWETAGKVSAYTLGGAAIGAGTGIAIGASNDRKYINEGLGIGIPVGGGVGLIAGLVTKGLNFVGHEGETVYVKLLEDVSVYN